MGRNTKSIPTDPPRTAPLPKNSEKSGGSSGQEETLSELPAAGNDNNELLEQPQQSFPTDSESSTLNSGTGEPKKSGTPA